MCTSAMRVEKRSLSMISQDMGVTGSRTGFEQAQQLLMSAKSPFKVPDRQWRDVAHPSVQPLLLRDDGRHEARGTHLHQSPGHFIQPFRILLLGLRVVQIDLAEINPISPVDLHVDQTGRENVPAEIDCARRRTARAEKGRLTRDDESRRRGYEQVGLDCLRGMISAAKRKEKDRRTGRRKGRMSSPDHLAWLDSHW